MDNCTGRGHQALRCPLVHSQWWRRSERREKKEQVRRCVLSALVTIIADTHQRPERHAHRGLRDDGVPMLHVEPICTQLRQLRVVVQELEQDDVEVVTPRPETQHCGHEQKKSANLGKRDDCTWRASLKKKGGLSFQKNVPRENLSPLRF